MFVYLLISVFKDCPDKPPSHAQIVRNEIRKKGNSLADFLKMISKKSFLLMLLCYGIHIGVFCAHATLLNRTFGFYFPVSTTSFHLTFLLDIKVIRQLLNRYV